MTVKAEIAQLQSMSAHADQNELMRWLSDFKRPPRLTCVVHGESDGCDALAARIRQDLRWPVIVPEYRQSIEAAMDAHQSARVPVPSDLLERVDEAAIAQLYADGFSALPLREKILVWHLYNAALAGRDIFYDQRYAHNLEMREVLEEIVTHAEGIDPATLAEITRYTKLFWLNTGPFNNLTARKFVLQCTPEAFAAAARQAARNGRALSTAGRRNGRGPARPDGARSSSTSRSTRSAPARRPGRGATSSRPAPTTSTGTSRCRTLPDSRNATRSTPGSSG